MTDTDLLTPFDLNGRLVWADQCLSRCWTFDDAGRAEWLSLADGAGYVWTADPSRTISDFSFSGSLAQ